MLMLRLLRRMWWRARQAVSRVIIVEDETRVSSNDKDDDEDDPFEPMPLWVAVIYGTIAIAVAVAIAVWFLQGYNEKYTYIQTVVLTLTLVVVAIYTNVTRKMQQAMVRQTNVGILPSFEIIIRLKDEFEPDADIPGAIVSQSRLELVNVGLGVALGVKIESIFVVTSRAFQSWEPIKFEKINSLSPGQKKVVKDTQPYDVATARLVGERRPNLLRHLVKRQTPGESQLKIWFTDILGNKYVQVIHIERDGIWSGVVQPDNGQVSRTTIIYNGKTW